jgi:hypothetical protein
VSAVGIPLEENLSISSLSNGIEVWLKPHALPTRTISCRVVAKNPLESAPQIFSLDCPLDAFEDELPCFVDLCRESISNEAQCKIAVVAVGDFEEKSLVKMLADAFEVFSERSVGSPTRMISVNPADSDMVYLSLSYSTSFEKIKTDQDLKKLWILYLLQTVVEEKFRKKIKDADGQWIQPVHAKYLLPYSHCVARGKQPLNQEPHAMLKAFLAAIQEVKSTGFSEQELSDAKAKLQKNLLNFYQQNPSSDTLADYLASHFGFGAGHPDYSIFMTLSMRAITEIQRADVAELLGTYFGDATRRVDVKFPQTVNINETTIQMTLDAHKTDNVVLDLDKNNLNKENAYSQLPITDEEANMIYRIIDTLGTKKWWQLAFVQGELKDLGNKVQHIHPLRFLGTLFTDSHLKLCMRDIVESSVKWKGFMKGDGATPGFIAKCEKEFARDNFESYILSFCQAVKAHPDQVRTLVRNKEWENLVVYLINLDSN